MVNHTPPPKKWTNHESLCIHSRTIISVLSTCVMLLEHHDESTKKHAGSSVVEFSWKREGNGILDNVLLGGYYCHYWTQSRASFWPKSWTVLMPSHVLFLLSAPERLSCIPRHNTIAGVRTPDLEHWTPSLISWVTLSWLVTSRD